MLTQILYNLYNRRHIEYILKDLQQKHSSYSHTHTSQEKLQLIGSSKQHNRYTMLTQLLYNLYNHHDTEYILMGLYLKQKNQLYTHMSQEKLLIIGNSDLNSQYTMPSQLLYNLYNHHDTKCILKDQQQKHSNYSYTHTNQEKLQLTKSSKQHNQYTKKTLLLYNPYNRRHIEYILKDQQQKHSNYSYTHTNQEKLQLIGSLKQYNQYTKKAQILYNLYNRRHIEYILKDQQQKHSSYSHTHKSQEKLQLTKSQKQYNQYTKKAQILYNLYNRRHIEYILKDLQQKHSSYSHTHTSQEKLQLIGSSKQHNRYTMLTQLLYNLYNHHDTEYILMGLYLQQYNQLYTHKSQEKLQLTKSSKQNSLYTKLTLLLYNLYNHHDIEYILKDLYLKYNNQSYTHMSLAMHRLKRHQNLSTLNTKKTRLLYNLYNHHDNQYKLRDLFQIHNILNCINIRQEKLQLKKQRQDCMSSNPIWFLHYKQHSHHGIENILKGWFHLHTTHLHKNKHQVKKVTQYSLQYNSSNPNWFLHYKQCNHRGIENILKDWYHLHTTHLHKNKLQEKKVTQYQLQYSSSNLNQYPHYKQYNHRDIENILKDQFHFHTTHLHKNKLQEKKVTQYQKQYISSNLNQYLHYKQYNHRGIENMLKDQFHFHTTHLHKNKLQEKKVTLYLQLHSSNNPNQSLHYKQYNHCDIENILKDQFHLHTTHLHKNKLQEKKVTQYQKQYSSNNLNWYFHYKQYNHRGIENMLKDWFHLHTTHLHKNKLQGKKVTQYQLQYSSSNLNQYPHYKQYNHRDIKNILKDWFHFHTTHLHKNKLQEKKVTQYQKQYSSNNPNLFLHYKQYNHRGIENMLKDQFHFHTTHLHKNKLQEKKVTLYLQKHSSSNPNLFLHYK